MKLLAMYAEQTSQKGYVVSLRNLLAPDWQSLTRCFQLMPGPPAITNCKDAFLMSGQFKWPRADIIEDRQHCV